MLKGSTFKRLTFEDRLQIETLCSQGMSLRAIGRAIGKTPTAISQEIKRGSRDGVYDARHAQKCVAERHVIGGREPILKDPSLAAYVAKLILEDRLTALQVIERLQGEAHRFREIPSSVNTIYNAIDAGLIPGVTRETLRSDTTKMFSNGQICIPLWMREELGFRDGDYFRIAISQEGCISLQKVSEQGGGDAREDNSFS